jgi:hypothetical protein
MRVMASAGVQALPVGYETRQRLFVQPHDLIAEVLWRKGWDSNPREA